MLSQPVAPNPLLKKRRSEEGPTRSLVSAKAQERTLSKGAPAVNAATDQRFPPYSLWPGYTDWRMWCGREVPPGVATALSEGPLRRCSCVQAHPQRSGRPASTTPSIDGKLSAGPQRETDAMRAHILYAHPEPHRLKALKRAMYGRASVALLCARMGPLREVCVSPNVSQSPPNSSVTPRLDEATAS
jgi:hypothetical protein